MAWTAALCDLSRYTLHWHDRVHVVSREDFISLLRFKEHGASSRVAIVCLPPQPFLLLMFALWIDIVRIRGPYFATVDHHVSHASGGRFREQLGALSCSTGAS